MTSPVRVVRRGAIVEVTLDRPKANAIDAATSRALYLAFRAFHDDPEARVAILTAPAIGFFAPDGISRPRRKGRRRAPITARAASPA